VPEIVLEFSRCESLQCSIQAWERSRTSAHPCAHHMGPYQLLHNQDLTPARVPEDLLFLICAHVLQVGERRLHVTIAQDGPRFQKSAPRDFDQPRTPHGMSGMMNAYPPTFPMSVPHRFPVPVSLLWRMRPLCLVAEGLVLVVIHSGIPARSHPTTARRLVIDQVTCYTGSPAR